MFNMQGTITCTAFVPRKYFPFTVPIVNSNSPFTRSLLPQFMSFSPQLQLPPQAAPPPLVAIITNSSHRTLPETTTKHEASSFAYLYSIALLQPISSSLLLQF
ncbi:hypothetical protein Ancab_007722 [Ancistrocladus abbreviatus]